MCGTAQNTNGKTTNNKNLEKVGYKMNIEKSITSILKKKIHFKLLTKKDAQPESRELSFIWSKMRTAAQERAPQTALRNCS